MAGVVAAATMRRIEGATTRRIDGVRWVGSRWVSILSPSFCVLL